MASNRIEIVKELRALEQFCTFKAVRSGEEQERFLKDYLADIQEFPLEAIQKACGKWRQSGQVKFPTPGQLIPLIRGCMAAEPGRHVEFWRELTDAEYEALSLRGKIEHQRILANLARRKAGPMWLNGKPAAPDELPQRWHEWTKRADNHEAEATRLGRFLRHPQMAAE